VVIRKGISWDPTPNPPESGESRSRQPAQNPAMQDAVRRAFRKPEFKFHYKPFTEEEIARLESIGRELYPNR